MDIDKNYGLWFMGNGLGVKNNSFGFEIYNLGHVWWFIQNLLQLFLANIPK